MLEVLAGDVPVVVVVVVVEEEKEEGMVVAVGEVEFGRVGAGVWLVLSVMEAMGPARAQSSGRAGRVGLNGCT